MQTRGRENPLRVLWAPSHGADHRPVQGFSCEGELAYRWLDCLCALKDISEDWDTDGDAQEGRLTHWNKDRGWGWAAEDSIQGCTTNHDSHVQYTGRCGARVEKEGWGLQAV